MNAKPIIHHSGCSWETTPYCNCGADPERVLPSKDDATRRLSLVEGICRELLDRMERGKGALSAVQEVHQTYGMPVACIIDLENLVRYLQDKKNLSHHLQTVEA